MAAAAAASVRACRPELEEPALPEEELEEPATEVRPWCRLLLEAWEAACTAAELEAVEALRWKDEQRNRRRRRKKRRHRTDAPV